MGGPETSGWHTYQADIPELDDTLEVSMLSRILAWVSGWKVGPPRL